MKRLTVICVFFVCCNYFSLGQTVSCKTLLQGAYQTGSLMSTDLTALIPGSQPYNVAPWNYPGVENLSAIPSNMVDWVLIELRDAVNPTIIIARRAVVLLNNGDIVDTNLTTLINFSGISPGNYYLCVFHRNHFPVMSANPVVLPNSISYDFSDTLNFPPYGGGSQALIELEPGVFGMIGGDANKDGVLKYSGPANDRGPVLQYIVNQSGSSSITTTVTGYREEDVSMESIIKYSGPGNDPSLIIQNLVGLTGSTSITSVYNSIVPHGITPFQCGDTLLDQRDGQKYTTVQIGSQCWMVENLAYLPSVSSSLYGSITLPYYYVHGYQGTSVSAAKATGTYKIYGVLYNWVAAMNGEARSDSVPSGVQGVCPDGWHLPSDEEWKILEGAVDSQYGVGDPEWDGTEWRGSDAGGNLKETGTTHWNSPNTGATNNSGFMALPGGYRGSFGSLYPLGSYSYYWTSTEYNSSKIWYRRLSYANTNVGRNNGEKSPGISIRCCKDGPCTPQPSQSDAGPDSLNIIGDSIILMGNNPVIGQGLWTIINGAGGHFADSANPTTSFYGLSDSTYVLVWTISNNCGSSSDTVLINFAVAGFVCGTPFVDSCDGQSYNTVQIGTQCWMAENLNIGVRINGSNTQYNNGVIEKYCYNNSTAYCDNYGGLYQWNEMMQYVTTPGVQGICPAGWYIPTDEDWKVLEGNVDSLYGVGDPVWDQTGYRGFDVGLNLKSTSSWNSGGNGTDLYGFSCLPSGIRSYDGYFIGVYNSTYLWTSTDYSVPYARARNLYYNNDGVNRTGCSKSFGNSVRCLQE